MRSAQAPHANVREALLPLQERRRLAEVVRVMAGEIERLEEDNIQLRAALAIYREAARLSNLRSPQRPRPADGTGVSTGSFLLGSG
jgi:hypothetical protein